MVPRISILTIAKAEGKKPKPRDGPGTPRAAFPPQAAPASQAREAGAFFASTVHRFSQPKGGAPCPASVPSAARP